MFYSNPDGKIIVDDLKDFNPKHILECGQTFRFSQTDTGYKVFSKKYICSLIYDKTRVIIDSNNTDYFINYFDLNRNYSAIKLALSGYPNLQKAINYGSGIRILNQDPAETIISFIISANNNIPRIRLILDRLCNSLGEDMGGYHAFPTIEALSSAGADFYRSIGAGYRAEYLAKTAKALHNGFNLELSSMDTQTAKKHLQSLFGVGQKVADCILLFAYHRTDAFPTDVWI
ncbi:MAG: DNA glycosylase, partial [Clostridia bacterium]